jgi:GntR family transcriptional regulator
MLDLASEKPLYLQLVDTLEEEIRESMLANDKLSSERELTQIYGVSRITVRLALQELENRGLVYKKHGKGTFVSEIGDSAVDLSTAYSFTEQMKKLGKVPQTSILSFSVIEAPESIAQEMQLSTGELIFELERLRSANDIPMMIERTYLPHDLFKELSQDMLNHRSLYELFQDYFSQTVRLADEEFYASIALDNEAKLLDIRSGDPVLHLLRKTYNTKNIMIEYTFSIARADQFRYKITHQRNDS